VTKNAELSNLEAALSELPIFPLPQVVLFPRALLPLHVFEPRYRTLLKDALATHRAMAMGLVVPGGDVDARGQPRIASVAGAGVILEQQELADGRSNIVLHGVARVRLEELPFVPPYRRARATILQETQSPVSAADRSALLAQATSFAQEVHKRDPSFTLRLPASLEAGAIADLCAHHLLIDAGVRQRVLEALDVAERVRIVTCELATQLAALRTSERTSLH
jgi:ATP-dependent Lon protease